MNIENDAYALKAIVLNILAQCGNIHPTNEHLELIESLVLQVDPSVQPFIRKGILTTKERIVLFWIANGKSLKEIAQIMSIKVTTVITYGCRIKKKLHCRTLAQATFVGGQLKEIG
jgi:DNA-binding CsgD family transcriptional regulator